MQTEHNNARVNTQVEQDRVCVTVTLEGKMVSQMRLKADQAESVAMQMLVCATELREKKTL
jgi:hypothetical protein